MPAAARIGDPIACGDNMAQGSGNVFVNGIPLSRLTDNSAGHGCFPATPVVSVTSPNVFTNNLPTATVNTQCASHSCGDTTHPQSSRGVTIGSPNVFINGG